MKLMLSISRSLFMIALKGKESMLKFARLSDQATTPTKASMYSAGYDLYSAHDALIPPRDKAVVRTDIQICVPDGTYGRVAPRSGLAASNFIDIGAGVIDLDYRGNVGVVMFNHSQDGLVVKKGDRIAQLICEKIVYPWLKEVLSLDTTERGGNGFGSSDRN